MQLSEVMRELEGYGNAQTRKTWSTHGAKGDVFGVKVGDMKKILKKTKQDHGLAMELFATGNCDAMYLAGLMADAKKVTVEELERWAQEAEWYMVSEYAVAGLAAESPHGWSLGRKWIDSKKPHVCCTGWATLGGVLSIRDNVELDLAEIESLLTRVQTHIHDAPNRVRYTMNGFVIAVGAYVPELTDKAVAAGNAIGKVHVDLGDTACKVPSSPDYIKKISDMGRLGKKRKYVRC